MTLIAGTKLGRYEIRSSIGAGGMGEVYLARDVEIGRDVAVKVLPSTFSADQDRLRRFQQEASAAGALNHPNILSIYDVGKHDGSPYVVSELLEGETLRRRIAGTPLAQRRAIDYALQIANGLAAAHEKGIIHRDLKPDNVFITNDGRVKILDFGLAKLTQTDDSQSQTEIPTRRVDTDSGVVMGTVGYMSPEQVRAQVVDHRSDIFAFGAILYEMLAGRRAFHGQSAADTMSAVLKEDPPELSDTNKTVSPALERLVNHCLEKNHEARFQSARDLAFALEALSASSVNSDHKMFSAIQVLPPNRWTTGRWPWIVSTILAILLIAALPFAIMYFRRPATTTTPEVSRFPIPLPDKSRIIGPPVVSPDGRRMAFRLNGDDGKEIIWIRAMESLDARPLNGTEGGTQPFWSPDSRSIGFFADGKLKRIEVTGGPAQALCDAPAANQGGTWGRNGVIVFAMNPTSGLYRVSANGGVATPITEVNVSRNELGHAWPYFLQDGHHYLYLARSTLSENSSIYVGSLDSKETKQLMQAHSSVAFAPPDFLLFVREDTLMAQGFNVDKLEVTGEPVSLTERTTRNPVNGRAFFSVSETGVLVVRTGDLVQNQLIWFDRTGKIVETLTRTGNYSAPALSPDEKRVAVSRTDFQNPTPDIWLIDMERRAETRFTVEPASDRMPTWSLDGRYITFVSTRAGSTTIYRKLANGAGPGEELLTSPESKATVDWSSDGQYMLYHQLNPQTVWDVWVLPLTGERKPQPILKTEFVEIHARFSPDGRWIAYASNETGRFEVYVQTFPVSGSKWPVSINGGSQPHWRGDGRELYFFSPDRKLTAVEVKGEAPDKFEVGIPQPLFEFRLGGGGIDLGFPGSGYYTVSRDGKRFLVTATSEQPENQKISVVQNWTAALKK